MMNKEIRELLLDKVGQELTEKGFSIADSTRQYAVYHRKKDHCIEIIQWAKDKYESFITVSASIAFLNTVGEKSNINFKWFSEFNNSNYDKINVSDCMKKYFLKGHFGDEFHYGDVYIAIGRGIVGVAHDSNNKPLGFKIKKYKNSTYLDLCDLIIKRMKYIYSWLDAQKQSIS
ncbi:MAG: hypothetical protein IKC58_03660 [Clostridia bacterium]|nr:hypothetical protein [Clostridia bacterium]MBR2985674.1 hypothetical protein [Clostridia bacterium]